MRPNGHSPLLAPGSTRSTTSPFWRFPCTWNHFSRKLRLGKNSFCHLFQTWPSSCWIQCHRFRGLMAWSLSASGEYIPSSWHTKWFGVSGVKSLGSELTYVIGLEFNRLPAPQIAVINSSSVTSAFPRMLFRACFALLIIDSKTPPKWGATGRSNCHCIGRCLLVSLVMWL